MRGRRGLRGALLTGKDDSSTIVKELEVRNAKRVCFSLALRLMSAAGGASGGAAGGAGGRDAERRVRGREQPDAGAGGGVAGMRRAPVENGTPPCRDCVG